MCYFNACKIWWWRANQNLLWLKRKGISYQVRVQCLYLHNYFVTWMSLLTSKKGGLSCWYFGCSPCYHVSASYKISERIFHSKNFTCLMKACCMMNWLEASLSRLPYGGREILYIYPPVLFKRLTFFKFAAYKVERTALIIAFVWELKTKYYRGKLENSSQVRSCFVHFSLQQEFSHAWWIEK